MACVRSWCECLRTFFRRWTMASSVLEDKVGLCCPDMRKGLELKACPRAHSDTGPHWSDEPEFQGQLDPSRVKSPSSRNLIKQSTFHIYNFYNVFTPLGKIKRCCMVSKLRIFLITRSHRSCIAAASVAVPGWLCSGMLSQLQQWLESLCCAGRRCRWTGRLPGTLPKVFAGTWMAVCRRPSAVDGFLPQRLRGEKEKNPNDS